MTDRFGPVEPAGRTPAAVLAALRAGNARYVANRGRHPHQAPDDRAALIRDQRPIAAVLGCSDARVPPSVILDQGLGDLFVVRVAGHVLGDDVVASVQYAVERLAVPVVLVLGHEGCGAVGLGLDAVHAGEDLTAPLIREVAPAARAALSACGARGRACALADAVGRHARGTAAALRDDAVLAPRIAAGELWIGSAVYRMDSGRVDALDGPEPA